MAKPNILQHAHSPLERDQKPDRAAAQAIADSVLKLQRKARQAGLKTLQGLLEICYDEAFSIANAVSIPEPDRAILKLFAALVSAGEVQATTSRSASPAGARARKKM